MGSELCSGWRAVGDGRRLWFGGILAVFDRRTSKAYFVATRSLGKRLWDNVNWLRRGTHPSPALQRAWSARPEDFAFFVVERVTVPWLLPAMKQMWIERACSAGGCYNAKRAVPRGRSG